MIVIRIVPSMSVFDEAVEAMSKIPGCCDEVWLSVYGYWPLERHLENAERLIPVVEKIRALGWRPVIEIGTNLGHGDYHPGTPVTDTFEKLTGTDGYVASGAYCPYGPNFLEYQSAVVSAYARTRPWGMYLDDDLRIEYHGRARYGCFCDRCVDRFNRENGSDLTRAQITTGMLTDVGLRERYVEQNRRGLALYAQTLTEAVMKLSPETYMGWEYVYLGCCNGEDFRYVFDAMHKASGKAPLSRPGCFFYQDHDPRLMLDKVLNTSYQNSIVPGYVKVRRPEIENTSHTVMGKSVAGTCVESALNLAYGCNGLSYSMISSDTEPLETRIRMWEAFAAHRSYWESLVADLAGTGVAGLKMAMFPDVYKAVLPGDNIYEFKWASHPKEAGRELAQIGLPLSYEGKFCGAWLLHPAMIDYLSDDDIRVLLAGNVLTDGTAVEKLHQRGFGPSLPVAASTAPSYHSETYTDHPANGKSAGARGYVDSFTQGVVFHTLKTGEGCEILAKNGDAVTCAIVHTEEGGSWGIVGASLWCLVINGVKRSQLTYLADYLCGGLPAYLASDERVMIIPRATPDGRFKAVTLLNLTIGQSIPLDIVIKDPVSESFTLSAPGKVDIPVSSSKCENGRFRVTVPPLPAWGIATVRAL